MGKIQKVLAREVIDSRGNPTVEAEVHLECGAWGRAIVPSGASTGTYEAVELRDRDDARFGGKGVRNAVDNVHTRIAPEIIGLDAVDQRKIDKLMLELDGSPNKAKLGANAILATSMAVAKAAAGFTGQPLYRYLGGACGDMLPVPLMNVINGGAHGDNNVDIQEFMIVPFGFESFRDALRAGCEIYQKLKGIVKSYGYATNVGDEGGFAPSLKSDAEALAIIDEAVKESGYKPGEQIAYALDCAASEFHNAGEYRLTSHKVELDSSGLMDFYSYLRTKYPIFSIEDPLAEDDWAGWKIMQEKLGNQLQIVGDDLLVTNMDRLAIGIQERACNSILIKLNQIGTVSETLDCIQTAQSAGWTTIISHRSGETEDTFISHLAVAVNAGQIKTGAPCRTDRTAKYNELLRIAEELGAEARFGGGQVVGGKLPLEAV